MADPAHALSALEVIIYAATTVGGVVGGVIAAVLRFGTRVKTLEETATKLRAELDEHKKAAPAITAGLKSDEAVVNALVDQRVTVTLSTYRAALAGDLATLTANYTSLKDEQDRMRDTSERESQEGSRRWSEMSAAIARIGVADRR